MMSRTFARRCARWIIAGGAPLAAAWFWHVFVLQGLLVPTRVSGGSMAPALLGAHASAPCPRCSFPLAWDLEDSPDNSSQVVCANCGHVDGATAARALSGDRLLIDRTATWLRSPRRWEPIVLQAPDGSGRLCVKRLVGMPHETIEIRDGDVWIDGSIARKSLAQLRAMAIPVYDDRYRAPQQPCRWQAADAESKWHPNGAGFECQSSWRSGEIDPATDQPIDWITYHHHQCWAGASARPGPICDDVAYNQHESRVLHEVRDVLLRFRVRSNGSGVFWIRAASASDIFAVRLDLATGRADLRHNDVLLATFDVDPRFFHESAELEMAIVDHQILLACNQREVLAAPYQPGSEQIRGLATPWAIGASGGSLRISDVQIWRDVYYGPPGGLAGAGQSVPCAGCYVLASDQYFVLGDNSPVSEDSRDWMPHQPVTDRLLVGKPLVWRYDFFKASRPLPHDDTVRAAPPASKQHDSRDDHRRLSSQDKHYTTEPY